MDDSKEPPQNDTYSTDICEPIEMEMGQSDDEDGQNGSVTTNDTNGRTVKEDQIQESCPDEPLVRRFDTKIIQVTNVSPNASLEQMVSFFGNLGDISDIKLYHYDQSPEFNFKVCFVEFARTSSTFMAFHLTNTVFIDRALIVLPYNKRELPDRDEALAGIEGSNMSTCFNYGVVSQVITGPGGAQVIATVDPRLTALNLTQYPHLPVNTDPSRIEEIRRTVYIGNLDSTVSPDQVMRFFNDIGEVKYIRLAGDDTQPTRFAFVEFTNQSSVANALQNNGVILGSRALKINHSNNAIVKPQPKSEFDDVSRKRDSNSASRDHGSRDRYHRDRERVRDRDRYYDERTSRSHRSRSRDRDSSRRHSRSRDQPSRRSRSRDRGSRRRSRSRDSRRKRSRSRSQGRTRQKHRKTSR